MPRSQTQSEDLSFDAIDGNRDGVISRDEWTRALLSMHASSTKRVDEVIGSNRDQTNPRNGVVQRRKASKPEWDNDAGIDPSRATKRLDLSVERDIAARLAEVTTSAN